MRDSTAHYIEQVLTLNTSLYSRSQLAHFLKPINGIMK